MADSDDEETARLRAMRTVAARMDARSGATGGGMQALLDKQRRATQAAASRSSAFFDDDDASPSSKRARVRSPPGRQEGRPEPLVLAPAEDEDAALRAMFPGGSAEEARGTPREAERARVLATHSRLAEGPTRPPGLDDAPGPAPGPSARLRMTMTTTTTRTAQTTTRTWRSTTTTSCSPTRRPWRATKVVSALTSSTQVRGS